MTNNKVAHVSKEHDDDDFPTAGLVGAGLVGGGALGLPYALGSNKEFSGLRAALQRAENVALPPNSTALTSYHDVMSRAAGLTPFGVPVGEYLSTARRSQPFMDRIGMGDYTTKTPQSSLAAKKHYQSFRGGAIPAYHHQVGLKGIDVPVSAGVEGGKGKSYADFMIPKLRSFLRSKGYGAELLPNEIDTSLIDRDKQIELMREFQASLPKDVQAEKSRVETDLWGPGIKSNTENYSGLIQGIDDFRNKSKTWGKYVGGAAGIFGLYKIIQYLRNRRKKEEKEAAFKESLFCLLKEAANREIIPTNEDSYLSTLAPKWSDKSHIVAALRDHLTDASGALDTELEAKEIADLALITDAYRRAHVPQELMDKRKAKFEEYAASPSMGTVDDVYVQSAVPAASRALVKKHGLLSAQALLDNPEALEAVLGSREGTDWEEDEETFKKRIDEKLKDTLWGDSMKGPSVFFGEPDSEKITDVHPMRKLKAEMLRVNLSKLLRDHPKTRIAGTELQPYDPEGPEHQGDLRHYDIDLDKVREYAAMDPKELWKHYDEPEGVSYAGNVPHAQLITSSGGIAPEYLDFGEKKAEDEENWYVATSGKVGKGLFAEKDFEVGDKLFHAGEKDEGESGLIDWEMTEASMATNHDRDPNVIVTKDGDTLTAVARKPIQADDEVFVSYFQVTHALGPGSRLTHNGKAVPTRSVEELEKWARQEKVDWAGLVYGNA